ncbi:MAG: hypothetical protein IPI67_17830 [Myxococcales bacterium]|nr:hypothetical protein [Myxococcales bacterium]
MSSVPPDRRGARRGRGSWVAATFAIAAVVHCGHSSVPTGRGAKAPSAAGPSAPDLTAPKVSAHLAPVEPSANGPTASSLLMIDSLRADMPWAGYPRAIAPWLSKFGERSTLYPRSYSISSYTAQA